MNKLVNKPNFTVGLNDFTLNFPEVDLTVKVDRLEDNGSAELSIYHENGTGTVLLSYTRHSLLSTQSANQLAIKLKAHMDIDWNTVLTYVSAMVMQEYRRGGPVVEIGKKPANMKIEYQLSPILEFNQPTTFYSPGGGLKSYLADYIACLIQFGVSGLDGLLKPAQANVCYLDWEASEKDHERRIWAIKQGLGINDEGTILYRRCYQPLADDIYSIRKIVSDNNIGFIIVDSQMAASGSGPNEAQLASRYYNALRSLKLTTLTLDHVNRNDWNTGESIGPYGTVVKWNRSRSQFEVKKSQYPGEDSVTISLKHKKHNEGKLLNDIGIKISFENIFDEAAADYVLDKVLFEPCDLTEEPGLMETLSLKVRLISALKNGKQTVKDLATAVDKKEANVKTTLNRYKKIFVKDGDLWELA